MIAALLLAASTPMTALDAERAFAADAAKLGQWTAFRKWAAPNAVMFDPKPVRTHEFLKDAKDPPRAIRWWPTASYVSCDGTMAVNTGGWERPDGAVGYFTTVWHKTAVGWRWTVDGGDALKTPRKQPREPVVERAACPTSIPPAPWPAVEDFRPGVFASGGQSSDASLHYSWVVEADSARRFMAQIKRAVGAVTVIDDRIPAPAPKSAAK